jgi:hypothetical protein
MSSQQTALEARLLVAVMALFVCAVTAWFCWCWNSLQRFTAARRAIWGGQVLVLAGVPFAQIAVYRALTHAVGRIDNYVPFVIVAQCIVAMFLMFRVRVNR